MLCSSISRGNRTTPPILCDSSEANVTVGDFSPKAADIATEPNAARVRFGGDVRGFWGEIADGDVRLAGIAQDRRSSAIAARDRRAEHRGIGPIPGALWRG